MTARQSVLVVDDEPQVLVAVEDLLSDEFDVLKADTPERALSLVHAERDIAVVISDQRMPRMNGDELFRQLDGHSNATRILLTGFADLSAVIRAVNDGKIYAYVTKPWNPDDLRLVVYNGAEHYRLGQELRTSEERLRLVFQGSAAGLFDWNVLEGNISYSPSFGHLLGYEGDEWAEPLSELIGRVHPEDAPRLREAIRKHFLTRAPFNGVELRGRVKSGDHRWFQASGQAVWDARGSATRLAGSITDISERKRLDRVSFYDNLTALPNRDLMRERISQAIVACRDSDRKFALVLFDIDRFRHVNETLGWAAGDELLRIVAVRLATDLPGQTTLARFGANSFAVLLSTFDDESDVALTVAKQLHEVVRQSVVVAETELRISLRAGIVLFPSDGRVPDALIGNAETALKSARSSGQRYLFYAPRMNARVADKLNLETRLRRAIENKEFLLFYQPKVSVKTGLLVGLEALIRWKEPTGKLVSPGEFIPVLEDTGLILEVGRWVLETAAQEHAGWLSRGLSPPRIAVNVSALQLAQNDFVSTLDAVIERFPNARSGLDLEITESVFVADMTGNVEKLHAARTRGFQVALDDFGTGYSSLGYLSRLPIDALKVDRSFVVRMVENPEDTAIVTTIISLAHALELKVIAEGVETSQQAHLLRLLRCDQLQGYLVARPAPGDEVTKLLMTPFRF